MNKLISVIVPIYNVEIYLSRCLNSIINQTYKNIEIILVDDGSPDNSGAICDEYAAIDSRIKVFHIPNGGVAKARQLGVESSTGEYIVFVDPDDWLTKNAITSLLSQMNENIDIIIGSYNVYDNKSKNENIENECILNNLLKQVLRLEVYPTPWGKMYRRSLFTKDSFPNFKLSQDWLMFFEIGSRVRSVKVVSDIVYNYYIRKSSTVRTFHHTLDYYIDYIHTGKNILLSKGIYEQHKTDYHEFALICLSRVNSGRRPIDKNHFFVKELLSEVIYKDLSSKGRVRYLSIRYRIYNIFRIIKQKIYKIINK